MAHSAWCSYDPSPVKICQPQMNDSNVVPSHIYCFYACVVVLFEASIPLIWLHAKIKNTLLGLDYCGGSCQILLYRIAGNFRQEKISPKPGPMYCGKNSPDLFSRNLGWAKLNSKVIYI